MILLQQMVILFFYMLIGYVAARKNILTKGGSRVLSFFVIHVANPALIISGSFQCDGTVTAKKILGVLFLACLVFGGLLLIATIVPRLLRAEQKEYGSYRVMTMFSNIGFMGLPVISAAYGGIAVLYASIFLLPFNLLIYTYGISQMQSDCKAASKKESVLSKWKKVCNIGVIACIVSTLLCFLPVQLPQVAQSAMTGLSGLTAPLSMFVIGSSFCEISFRSMFSDVRMLLFALIKLVGIPCIGMFVIHLFLHDALLLEVCFVMLATPVGSMTAMLAKQYGGNEELTSKGVALTTICSVVTMPFISLFL